ncbi:peroxidasin homolog [Glandiceps talaboti]
MKPTPFLVCVLFCIHGYPDTIAVANNDVVDDSINIAINKVEKAIFDTRKSLVGHHKPTTPEELLNLFRFPSHDIVDVAKADEIFETILKVLEDHNLLTPELIKKLMEVSGCSDFLKGISCDDACMCSHAKYRTADGTCNNINNPTQGAAKTPFARLLHSIYEDGFSEPVGWNPNQLYNGHPKPSPRLVSTEVGSTTSITEHPQLSNFVMLMGQFLDHDIDLTPQSPSSVTFKDGTKCSETCDNDPPCFPIPIPDNDPRIGSKCTEFIRSSGTCGSGLSSQYFGYLVPREQMNAITSYIDGSQIYGSSKTLANKLRAFDGKGRLRVNDDPEVATGRPLLPFDPDSPMACLGGQTQAPCFLAGDVRSNEQLGLTAMHTLFLREHNRLAVRLSDINPHWDENTLYEETRKIVGAKLQHIIYDHYLPKVLGPEAFSNLWTYDGYDSDVDASIFNVFATGAFRFGHGTIRPIIRRLKEDLTPIPEGNLPLHLAFFQPWRIVEEGGIDPLLRGFLFKAAKSIKSNELLTDEVTEHLFELANTVALDLMALNIQRGRDHGLPGYTAWREKCGLSQVNTFGDLKSVIKKTQVRNKLKNLYKHVDNIDLFVGGLAEDPVTGGVMGPTFTCILTEQFHNLRSGDRFWYENKCIFSPAQIAEIKKSSISRIICDNTDITEVQEDVFLTPSKNGPMLPCDEIQDMDLTPWTQGTHEHTPPNIVCPADITIQLSYQREEDDEDDHDDNDDHSSSSSSSSSSSDSDSGGDHGNSDDDYGHGDGENVVEVSWDIAEGDHYDDPSCVTCSRTSGSKFPLGVTKVTCSITDSGGNCATCSFSVTVIGCK